MAAKWTAGAVDVRTRRMPPGAARNFALHVRPVAADGVGGGFADEGAKQMSTVAGETMTAYVVRGADGRVVVAFWGESALEEADRWLERDYRVDRLELPVE
jgi:hypothetical protein